MPLRGSLRELVSAFGTSSSGAPAFFLFFEGPPGTDPAGKLLLGLLVISPCASAAKQYSEVIFPALQLYRTPSTRL